MFTSELDQKIHLLMGDGFKYILDRDIYCNLRQNKCFSLEYIEDNSISIIRKNLAEPPKKRMVYYFNKKPSALLRKKLEQELRVRKRRPDSIRTISIKRKGR